MRDTSLPVRLICYKFWYLNSHFYVIFPERPLWCQVTQRCDSELPQFRPLAAISAVRTCSTHVSANIHDASLPNWATFWHHSLHAHTPGFLLSCLEVTSPTECNSGIFQKSPFECKTTTQLKNMTATSGNTGTIVSRNTPRWMHLLLGVVVTFLSSIVVLTPNGQFFGFYHYCVQWASCKRCPDVNESSGCLHFFQCFAWTEQDHFSRFRLNIILVHNEELFDSHSPSTIIRAIKSSKILWAEH